MLNALPIVSASDVDDDDHKQHINGRCRKLLGTFSATDLWGCYQNTLKSRLGISALAFTEQIETSPLYTTFDTHHPLNNVIKANIDDSSIDNHERFDFGGLSQNSYAGWIISFAWSYDHTTKINVKLHCILQGL